MIFFKYEATDGTCSSQMWCHPPQVISGFLRISWVYMFFVRLKKGTASHSLISRFPHFLLKNEVNFSIRKKCILMRYLSKMDIFIEFFIYGGPLVPLLHTVKQTPSWIKTCSLCEIVLIVLVHHLKPSTALYFCHGVFTDKSTFSLNLPRTKTSHERTTTNQD